jgi:hypothetical protein
MRIPSGNDEAKFVVSAGEWSMSQREAERVNLLEHRIRKKVLGYIPS